jgi:glycosyltransferase involved in cell wall biosynthesis
MRILLVNSLYAPFGVGGAERSVQELAEGLALRGHTIAVATLGPSDSKPSVRKINGVYVHRMRLSDVWPYDSRWHQANRLRRVSWHVREIARWSGYRHLRSLQDQFQPDVVNTHNLAGFSTAVWTGIRNTPLVHTLRDYYLLCNRTTLFRTDKRCGRDCKDCRVFTAARRNWPRSPDMVVGVSRFVLDLHHRSGLLLDIPSRVIYNSPRIERSLPVRRRSRTLGFLGRLDPAKGVAIVLGALSIRRDLEVTLLVAGGGTSNGVRLIEEAAKSDGRVRLVGPVVPDRFFSEIDALVVPSQWDEPFGRVAAEARSAGIWVIGSRVGGIPEVLNGYKRSILISDFENPQAWLAAIRSWLRTAPEDGATAARSGEEPAFDAVSAYEKVYAEARCLARQRMPAGTVGAGATGANSSAMCTNRFDFASLAGVEPHGDR